jgi:hypothetical protein
VPPRDLAGAFGWDRDEVRQRSIAVGQTKLDVGRSYLGVQPAALFASPTARNGVDPLEGAALYGYHAAVRWGILADERGLTAFNSHWTVQDRWFSLPTIAWHSLEEQRSTLEAFQPQNLTDGEPDRIALERYPVPSLLQPVDDELVERLDAWRDEALKAAKSSSGVDEQLQVLFAKLFVLRTIEDRNLAPAVTPLSASTGPDDRLRHETLAATFAEAKEYIGSELFDAIDLAAIPEYVVVGIIRDLYTPRRLPGPSRRYNFSWIDSDVLGMAYEKYLSTILHPAPPAPQQDLFREFYRDVNRISVRRAGGVYYTPEYLTKYLSRRSIEEFFRRSDADAIPRIIDFACGSGSFLVAALDVLLQRLKRTEPTKNWGREIVEGGYINGVDIDEKAVTVARLNLWNRLTEEPDPLPLPNLSKVIVQGDGLREETWGELPRRYDIALGNPPFLATSRVSHREELEAKFSTARGRYDYSYLFVEQAIRITESSGAFGMVLPNRIFRNHNGAAIRSMITKYMNIEAIVDFGSNEVFQGTSAYIGCLIAAYQPLLTPPQTHVKVIEVKSLPDQFVAAHLIEAEQAARPDDKNIRVYLAQHPRGSGPWVLLSASEKNAQIRLSDKSVTLDAVAGIFQGIRTGANDVFLLKIVSEDEQYSAEVSNGFGDSAVLERGLLQPVVYGAEVRKYEIVEYDKYLIYPYVNGTVISEAEMETRYPQTHRYLLAYRDILANRTSIAETGLRWYELVRRRDEDWLRRPKLLIRDLAPETAFAADPLGEVFMVGGTAVSPETEEQLFPLLGYLNSRAVTNLMRRVTPQFRGNFQKFEPQHLQRIPVLLRILEDDALMDRLGGLARSATIAEPGQHKLDIAEAIDNLVLEVMTQAGIELED